MKSLFRALLLTLLLTTTLSNASAQNAESESKIRVAKYQGDRVAALSYTFDDGLRDHYTIAFPMLEEFGFRGTFFIVGKPVPDTTAEAEAKKAGSFGTISWPEIKRIADKGHEIGSHSWTHANLQKLEDAELNQEIDLNVDKIKEKLGFAPLTFCYPGNGRNDHVRELVLKRHIAAREFQFEIGQEKMTTADANAWADGDIEKGGWGIAMIHAITAGYHPLSSPDILRQHFVYVKSKTDKIWVDSFANVTRYIAERDAAQLTVRKWKSKSASFVLDCSLNRPPYDVPLTVVLKTGAVKKATAKRGKQILPLEIRGEELLVTATPDSQPIQVEWK